MTKLVKASYIIDSFECSHALKTQVEVDVNISVFDDVAKYLSDIKHTRFTPKSP